MLPFGTSFSLFNVKRSILIGKMTIYRQKDIKLSQTDNIESHASVQFAVGMIGYTFYMIFWTIAALIIWNNFLFAWLIIMPALGWIYLIHRELTERWKWAKGFLKLTKNEQENLKEMRAKILKKVGA